MSSLIALTASIGSSERIAQLPVEVPLAGKHRARIAASHCHHDVRPLDVFLAIPAVHR